MAEATDVLLKLWEDQRIQARHTESQRATITNFVILISVAIISFFTTKGINQDSLPLAVLLVILEHVLKLNNTCN